jgi:hypothetical protein
MAANPFALPINEPLTLTLAAVFGDASPCAELVAVMSPVETIVPVLELLRPWALATLPPVSVLVVTVTVPVLELLIPTPDPPAIVLDVTVIDPVLGLLIQKEAAPAPPVIVLDVTVTPPVLALFMP